VCFAFEIAPESLQKVHFQRRMGLHCSSRPSFSVVGVAGAAEGLHFVVHSSWVAVLLDNETVAEAVGARIALLLDFDQVSYAEILAKRQLCSEPLLSSSPTVVLQLLHTAHTSPGSQRLEAVWLAGYWRYP
jgi:hypothetical protein